MKVLALSGSNADNSFNEKLLKVIIKDLGDKYDFDFATVKGLPMYKEGVDAPASVLALGKKIADADMVLIASPEQQHSVSSALKSALEWLGSHAGPNVMKMKPAAVVGTSYGIQGSSRAQEDAREILLSPDMSANVLPGNEILIGGAASNFDKETGDLTNEDYIKQLDAMMANFIKFVEQANK